MAESEVKSRDASGSFVVWPPPRVSEVDPYEFGVATGLAGPAGRELNPYVPRDIDATLDRTLNLRRGVIVSAPAGAGATRTVYESLNRLLRQAYLLIPRRPGDFDPDDLQISLQGDLVLWIDKLGAHWAAEGPRLIDNLRAWFRPGRWLVAVLYDSEETYLPRDGGVLRSLNLPVIRLASDLTPAELDAMRAGYGQVATTSSIGFNPPVPSDPTGFFSRSVRDALDDTGDGDRTASAIAEPVRQRHPEYAGGRLSSVTLDPDLGDRRPLNDWLARIRACYDPAAVTKSRHEVIDTRLTLAALAALDPPVSAALGADTLAALRQECEVLPKVPAPASREYVKLLIDDPVGLDGDELGRRGVATALEEQLRRLAGAFPGRSFLVHVDGAWGAGKSTLLRFLDESVAASTGANRWLVVSYDAWRQSRAGPPWLTLLQAVRKGVRSTRRTRLARGWFWLRERARLVGAWQWVTLVLLVGVAGALAWYGRNIDIETWGDVVKLVGGLLPVIAALWLVGKAFGHFVALDSPRSARTFVETRADPMEDLAAHFGWLLRHTQRPVLLLLIDDLDRCPETFVVELLDAIQKLMRDRPPGTDGQRQPTLIAVVAADGRWVRGSYDNAYAALADAVREPGATLGSLFLEKIFQLTVPVPQLSDELRTAYLRDLLSVQTAGRDGREADPDLVRRLSEARHDEVLGVLASVPPIERVKASQLAITKLVVEPAAQESTRHALEPYAPLLDPTPRAMKRFVMAYSLLRAVRTAEGSVVGLGPLALWTIVRTRWPMLADHLQAEPEAVRLFTVPAKELPTSTPAELVPLFSDPSGELRAVMNHRDGPLDAQTIRACSGQA